MTKNLKWIIIIDLILIVLMLLSVFSWFQLQNKQNKTLNKLGYKKTKVVLNQIAVNNQLINLTQSNKSDLIRITNILPNQTISSPLNIEGEARGIWFFEASFPIALLDQDRNIIIQGVAQAVDDWMTTDFVRFKAKLEFTKPLNSNQGFLIFKKDNPSGLPQYDDSYEMIVNFK